jgi:cytochrome c peroxidase
MKKYLLITLLAVNIFMIQAATINKTSTNKASTAAQLGKLLFFDPILSRDFTISCASCHKPAFAFSDTSAVSMGVYGRTGSRNTPTVMNILLRKPFFWDGRAATLEEQSLMPIADHNEMDLSLEEAVQRLKQNAEYRNSFTSIFQHEPTPELLAKALAAFQRTLETSDSPFDRWQMLDDSTEITADIKKGLEIFNGKGKCVTCHFGSDFTRSEFRNIGLFDGRKLNDSGRYMITRDHNDLGKFKTPTLRNIALTGPYMHNGMFKSLDEVIDFYNEPGKIVPGAINRDSLMSRPLDLTQTEKQALKAFLLSLTDRQLTR